MRVRNLLETKKTAEVITIAPSADVPTAARLLLQHTIGGLPVVRPDGVLVGFVSERDFVRTVNLHTDRIRSLTVEQIMRPAPTCTLDDAVNEVTARMNNERLRHLVVLDGRRIAGIISVGDLIKRRV